MTDSDTTITVEGMEAVMAAQGQILVDLFFDGTERTCATDFKKGSVCKFYRTQRFGTVETCLFAPRHGKYFEQLQRRGDYQKGSLIPGKWCPVEEIK